MDWVKLEAEFEGLYQENAPDLETFRGKKFFITGVTGLIGSYLALFLVFLNKNHSFGVSIQGMGRNRSKFESFFGDSARFIAFFEGDINKPVTLDVDTDFLVHLASNATPSLYANFPIETEMTLVRGTYNLFMAASALPHCRIFYGSSGDVYGAEKDPSKRMSEKMEGYIDSTDFRSCYTEGKRATETLCKAFEKEKGLDIVIGRICRVFGPSIREGDGRAVSSFLFSASKGHSISLTEKSKKYTFTFLYAGDVVSSILFLLSKAKGGEVFNIGDNINYWSLDSLANFIADVANVKVVYNSKDMVGQGYSNFENSLLDCSKLLSLGWKPTFNVKKAIYATLSFLAADSDN
jgi:UDP-glucuronate decarboxylase